MPLCLLAPAEYVPLEPRKHLQKCQQSSFTTFLSSVKYVKPGYTCLFKKLELDSFWKVTGLIVNFIGGSLPFVFCPIQLELEPFITGDSDVFHISEVRP